MEAVEPYQSDYVLGIDLGNATVRVAVWHEDKIQIIPNAYGQRSTPSFVTFNDQECLIGCTLKETMFKDGNITISNIMRLIGRKFDDPCFQTEIKSLSFDVQQGPDNRPLFLIRHKGIMKKFYPEQFTAMILGQVKQDAEIYLGKEVKEAVISVPALFNNRQRKAIKDAGSIAGFTVLRTTNSSLSSALAFGFDRTNVIGKNILVVNLGSGAFDASIVAIQGHIYTVRATVGDTLLGGKEFDDKLIEYCIGDIEKQTGFDIKNNLELMRNLKIKCEAAKVELTFAEQTTIELEIKDTYKCLITRKKFEELCSPLFSQIIQYLDQVLQESQANKTDISDIVLGGGSSKIPRIHELLIEYFDGKELIRSINPDEAVVYGVAIQAALLSNSKSKVQDIQDVIYHDVITRAISFQKLSSSLHTFIPKNTPIPKKVPLGLVGSANKMPRVPITVYEGEKGPDNVDTALTSFVLTDLPRAPKGGVHSFEVMIEIDESGILSVGGTKRCKVVDYDQNCGRLTENLIKSLGVELNEFLPDIEVQTKIVMKKKLLEYCETIKSIAKEKWFMEKAGKSDIDELEKMCEDTVTWLENNHDVGKVEYMKRKEEIQEKFNIILGR